MAVLLRHRGHAKAARVPTHARITGEADAVSREQSAHDMATRIERLAQTEPGRLGLPEQTAAPAPRNTRVRLLGQGESYTAWRLDVDGTPPLVVRVTRRAPEDLPRPMSEEFAALALLPDGIGPSAVLLEQARDNPLGSPYMVCGYVPGRVLRPAEWNDGLLAAHARQMSRLHARAFDRCGDVGAPAADRATYLSPTRLFTAGLTWWSETFPHVIEDPEVSRLLPRVETFMAASEPAFRRLERFALVHGDLVVPNILVDDAGTPRYVDWEWAEIGDPARDLAYIGGRVPAPPWYLPLDGTRIRRFLESYLRHVPDTGETLDSLETRRDAWEVYERFFSSLHFRTRRDTPEDRRTGLYSHAVAQLTAGLHHRLARS
ncbi:aminoglycoside phosphotransferase family protein [Streptomyces montanus]|uniref:Aminoglycoside phosphotransferase family protein n=1 Tax=Streptomyces montanus TaxID=2580423 RepID=A0A5R9FRY3_9ACTN|nr:aminoglycoside phosphotransferase family protein [Streptomyces montanus]